MKATRSVLTKCIQHSGLRQTKNNKHIEIFCENASNSSIRETHVRREKTVLLLC